MAPRTRYAKVGDLNIAYQVVSDAPLDFVLVPSFVSNIELWWADPDVKAWLDRLASFARLILFDKLGTGLSDPVSGPPPLEQRVQEIEAVMDAAGSERAVLFGLSEGGPSSIVFAATRPQRVKALILFGTYSAGVLPDGSYDDYVAELAARRYDERYRPSPAQFERLKQFTSRCTRAGARATRWWRWSRAARTRRTWR